MRVRVAAGRGRRRRRRRDGLAARPGVVDGLAHALVVGDFGAAAGVVADGHPPSALPANGQALQQRGAFPGRAGGPVGAAGGGVAEQDLLIGLVGLPGDVSGVGAGDQRGPLVPRQRLAAVLAVGAGGAAAAAVDERAGVAGVVQGAQHPPVGQRHPGQLALARPGADPHRERQVRRRRRRPRRALSRCGPLLIAVTAIAALRREPWWGPAGAADRAARNRAEALEQKQVPAEARAGGGGAAAHRPRRA